MDIRQALSTLARQIDLTRARSEQETLHAGLTRAIFRSFRVTYLALSTGLDPWKDASHLFMLLLTDTGLPLLTQEGQPVPVNTSFLVDLFRSAGVDLLPGQTLLLEPEIAKAAIEEALGGIALEQAQADRDTAHLGARKDDGARAALETRRNLLWDRKVELIAASFVAEEYLSQARAVSVPGLVDPEQEAA
jgi:hypothetical protein